MIAMISMGFCRKLRKMVYGCISTTSFLVLVEGSPTTSFRSGRGIRQGDPLSPMLFNMVADYLSRMLMTKVEDGFIEPYAIRGVTTPTTYFRE